MLKAIAHLRNVKGVPRLAARLLEFALFITRGHFLPKESYLMLAGLYNDIGETKKALRVFERAARKTKSASDELLYADILRKWGYVLLHARADGVHAYEKIDEAIRVITRLLSIKESREAKPVLCVAANCYAALGNYWCSRSPSEAKNCYNQALDFATRGNFPERVITLKADLGTIAIGEENWHEADRLLREALSDAWSYYQHAVPSSLVRLGHLYMEKKNPNCDFKKSEGFILESLRVAKKSGWRREQGDAFRALGKLAEVQGNKAGAEVAFNHANGIYDSIGYAGDRASLTESS